MAPLRQHLLDFESQLPAPSTLALNELAEFRAADLMKKAEVPADGWTVLTACRPEAAASRAVGTVAYRYSTVSPSTQWRVSST